MPKSRSPPRINARSNRGDGMLIADMQKNIHSYYMSPINIKKDMNLRNSIGEKTDA